MKNYLWGPYLLVINMNVLDAIKLFHMIPVVRDFDTSNAISNTLQMKYNPFAIQSLILPFMSNDDSHTLGF